MAHTATPLHITGVMHRYTMLPYEKGKENWDTLLAKRAGRFRAMCDAQGIELTSGGLLASTSGGED